MGLEKQNKSAAYKRENDQVYGIGPIAAHFENCLQYFERLSASLETRPSEGTYIYSTVDGCLSEFRMWGNDTGAPEGLLDHALRKSSRLQKAAKDLLLDLYSTLHTMCDNLEAAPMEPTSPRSLGLNTGRDSDIDFILSRRLSPDSDTSLKQHADDLKETTNLTSSESTRFNSSQDDHIDPSLSRRMSSDSETSLQQCADDLEGIVSCLTKLIPALQDPAPQDMYSGDASLNESNEDIKLVGKLFPKVVPSLATRLGFSNWKRRQYFQKLGQQNRQNKSARQSLVTKKHENHQDFSSELEILKSDYRAAFSSHRVGTGDSYDAGPASLNESIFSRPHFSTGYSASSVSDLDPIGVWNQYEIPKPPVMLGSRHPFDCPYCGQEIFFGVQIASEDDWAHHIFMDLEPYQCTFDDCARADKTYGVREDWFRHELDHHRLRKVWYCQPCADEFDQRELFELHLTDKHNTDISHLPTMVSLCQKFSEKTIADQACPFCGVLKMTSQELKEHVANHMEQLALMTIPSAETHHSSIDAISRYKADLIEDFIRQQRDDYFKQPVREQPDNDTDNSDPFFADDSDDEMGVVNLERPSVRAVTTITTTTRNSRPRLERSSASYTKKVNSYLENQQKNTKVETFLESQAEYSNKQLGSKSFIPVGSPEENLAQEGNLAQISRDQYQDRIIPPFRTKPPPRNEDFVGRAEELTKLQNVLSTPGSICVLSGAVGTGKTKTAIEYTYRYEGTYSHIFWISAESAISCADSYSLIATHLVVDDDGFYEQGRLITLGRDFLEQTEKRWLIVFDNVNLWSEILQYLPTDPLKTNGSILITARKSNLNALSKLKYQSLELGALTLDEGRQLLLLSMQPDLDHRQLKTHPEYKLAGEIASLAERLPLALAHIAGYLQVSKCTLTDFVQLWNERRRHTKGLASQDGPLSLSTDRALETVWNIGLREVTIDARELLDILAFLDSETIQRGLLVGEHEEPSLDFLHSDQSFRYKRMISELSCRRLIVVKIQDGEEILSIHRSLQLKILKDIDRDSQKRESVFAQAFLLVRKRFPLPSPIQVPEPEKWPICKENLMHVLQLQKVAIEILPAIKPTVYLARLLSDGGIDLWERGMTNEGLRLLRSAETILDKLNCDEKQLRANIHIIIALLIQDSGLDHIAESKDRIWKALQIRVDYLHQTPLGLYTREDDILLHNAFSDYGCVLLQYNRYDEAEPIFRKCLEKYHEWGKETDIPYEYYKFNHHTAFCRLYHRDFAEAIKLAEEGLRMIILATGQSSAASKTQFDLACIVLQSGDLERALDLHQKVLESNLKQHGKFSFLTLQSYYAVGALHAYRGELMEAEQLMTHALSLERLRPGTWPEAAIARTEFHLSQILKQQQQQQQQDKDPEEADQLASKARTVLTRLLKINPLEGVDVADELALFDHLQPVFDGRFTGRDLLKYVSSAPTRPS